MTPHIAEELWAKLGNQNFLCDQLWPKFEENLTLDTKIDIAVQVNGKLRGKIEVTRGSSEQLLKELALNLDNVKKQIENKEIRRIIIVPNRIINVVV